MNKAKPGGIDYLYHAQPLIGRVGYTLNIVTGCRHHETGVCKIDCYARRMVERGFLKGHPSYPYGFAPTFHPERIRAIGGDPKLIFLNDMGDCGGKWTYRVMGYRDSVVGSGVIAKAMASFALLNPQHVVLLLTKNPSWYALAEWPENVWPGFSATNNEEYGERLVALTEAFDCIPPRWWCSWEPYLDEDAPNIEASTGWLVIGGLTGPGGKIVQPVSDATMRWLDGPFDGKRFVKSNADWSGTLREYPESWKVNRE